MIGRIVFIASVAVMALALGCRKQEDSQQPENDIGRGTEGAEKETPKTPEPPEKGEPKETPKKDTQLTGGAPADNKTESAPGESDKKEEKPSMKEQTPEKDVSPLPADLPAGLYAIMETTKGAIIIDLFEDDAPETVGNFVGLATGTKAYTDPRTRAETKDRYYDGLTFHRVMPKFMIQGGCPLGNGRGGPGYTFADEFVDRLKFNTPGLLAMANSGPATNGGQFFITVGRAPHLNNKHTIFGIVVKGYEVAVVISEVKRDRANDKPLTAVVVKRVTIQRVDKK